MTDFYSDVLLPKLLNILFKPIIILIIILFFTALYIIIRLRAASHGPLKYGRVISADHTPDNWRKPDHPLFSKRYLLTGNPDYLIQEKDKSITPVEVKSTPWRGRIYDSQRMQLAGYCLLVEECLHKTPKHGIIMYGDGTTRSVPYTNNSRQNLLQTMKEMRSLTLPQGWYPDSRRCRSCSMKARCNMAVA